ncbi:hypothetical protein Tco_1185282 [Tanacetum coccineum]
MVYQLTKFHVQRVDMVINPPWNLPFLGAKGLTSPEQTATVEMVFSQPWTCTFLVAKGLTTPELMANCTKLSLAVLSSDDFWVSIKEKNNSSRTTTNESNNIDACRSMQRPWEADDSYREEKWRVIHRLLQLGLLLFKFISLV